MPSGEQCREVMPVIQWPAVAHEPLKTLFRSFSSPSSSPSSSSSSSSSSHRFESQIFRNYNWYTIFSNFCANHFLNLGMRGKCFLRCISENWTVSTLFEHHQKSLHSILVIPRVSLKWPLGITFWWFSEIATNKIAYYAEISCNYHRITHIKFQLI